MRRHSYQTTYPNDEIKQKLNTAFQVLRVSYGYLAKQSFLCCGSCAWSEAASMIAANPGKYRGVVFYHKQDADDLKGRKNPGCYLAFGTAHGESEFACKIIGQNVAQVMSDVGLKVDWNGDNGTRIWVGLPEPKPVPPPFLGAGI